MTLSAPPKARPVLVALLIAFGICWGTTIPLGKIAVSTGHAPIGITFWEMLLLTLILGGVLFVRGQRLPMSLRHWGFYAVVGIGGTVLPNTFSYWAMFHLPSGIMALILTLIPMFSLGVALAIGSESLVPRRMFGVALGALAIVLIVGPDVSLPDRSKIIFVFVGMLAPICYALEGNFLAQMKPRLDPDDQLSPLVILCGAGIVGTLFSLPLALATGTFIDPRNGLAAPEYALLGLTFFHIIAYTGYIWMIGQAGAVFASQISYIVTLTGVIFSVLFLGEAHAWTIWLALAVLLVALSMVQPRSAQ